MLPTVDFNLHAVSEIILLMSKYYQFVVFKVLAAEHSRYDISRLKKSLSKINLRAFAFFHLLWLFLSSSILCNQASLKVLLLLFNYSFSTGLVPDQFKVARVVPIHKKRSSFLVSNYRPISLLSIFNKVIEKLKCNRITIPGLLLNQPITLIPSKQTMVNSTFALQL